MAEGLVWIGRVAEVRAIEGADRIELAIAVCGRGGKWSGCIQKGSMKAGDACQVYLQDALLPHTPELAFMERHHWRVRMARFRGQPSECLIMPQSVAGDVGQDVTGAAGVEKYEKPIPLSIAGEIAGNFPAFIPRTDEPNFQSVPGLVAALRGQPWRATVKLDGSSCTFYRRGDEFGVCSRNWRLRETPGSVLWRMARKYQLYDLLPDEWAIQCEVVGPGIQGNPLGLDKPDIYCFDAYNIGIGCYMGYEYLRQIKPELSVPAVRMCASGDAFALDDEWLRMLAEAQVYPNGKPAEGIVVRPVHEQSIEVDGVVTRLSFKVLNLAYKG